MIEKLISFDWMKIFGNVTHLSLLLASAYASVTPKWAWMVPVFQAYGMSSQPVNFVPRPKG